MRILLQRVTQASVDVDGKTVSDIAEGYLLFLGVIRGDTKLQAEQLAEKIVKLRLFDSEDGKINDRSITEVDGEILVVSQFTLAGRFEKGNRPDYTQAAPPDVAEQLYEHFCAQLSSLGVRRVGQGIFGAMMQVHLINNGPVTLFLER